MDPNLVIFKEFESAILKIDPAAHDCRLKVADVRRQTDAACDVGHISMAQWRYLLDRVAAIQARCVATSK